MRQHHLASWSQRADTALFWLIPVFLLVDCLNGAIAQYGGANAGLAIGYKVSVLLLMLGSLAYKQPKLILVFTAALLLLLVGPAMHWPTLSLRWVIADVQLAVKLLSPLIAFSYLYVLSQQNAAQCFTLCQRSMYVAVSILLLNTLAGLAGLGFAAYQPLDGVAQSFLGIKGFFYSTNELSAVLLVLCCAVLSRSWQYHKLRYMLAGAVFIAIAALMLTKTGLFGVLILVVLTPLLLQRHLFWRQNTKLLTVLASALLLLCLVIWFNAESLLRMLGMYDKLQFVYQQRGISGILLSSRDYYAGKIWQLSAEYYNNWQRLVGVGQGGVAAYLKKYFAEIDWFDLFIFHGLAGLAAYVATFATFLRAGWQRRYSGAGRCLLLLNLLLLLVSSTAGHILTSGMLWLPWALCCMLLILVAEQERNTTELK